MPDRFKFEAIPDGKPKKKGEPEEKDVPLASGVFSAGDAEIDSAVDNILRPSSKKDESAVPVGGEKKSGDVHQKTVERIEKAKERLRKMREDMEKNK